MGATSKSQRSFAEPPGTRLIVAVLCCVFIGMPVHAQACHGFRDMSGRWIRASLETTGFTYARLTTGSLAFGREYFVVATGGRAYDAGYDRRSTDVRLRLGKDHLVHRMRRIHACPAVGLGVTYAFADPYWDSNIMRILDWSASLGAVRSFPGKGDGGIRLGGHVEPHRMQYREFHPTGSRLPKILRPSRWDTYWVFSGHASYTFRRVSVVTNLSIPQGIRSPFRDGGYAVPFGRADRERALTLAVGLTR